MTVFNRLLGLLLAASLTACALIPEAQQDMGESIDQIEHSATPVDCADSTMLRFSNHPCDQLAWHRFVYDLALTSETERSQWLRHSNATLPGQLQAALIRSHPDNPNIVRLRGQGDLLSLMDRLPANMVDFVHWIAHQNQYLLEAEMTITQLNRLSAQQQQSLDDLTEKLAEKSAQLDALTEIEQRLNSMRLENDDH
ncbi:MAG: hypothetical protein LAT65_04115 [Saccharospirillum sp.]|nr:hypothetical protein [Saccharospirillum sp.]